MTIKILDYWVIENGALFVAISRCKTKYDLKLNSDLKMVYFSSERKLNTMVKAQPLDYFP